MTQIAPVRSLAAIMLFLMAAACTGPDAVPPGGGKQAAGTPVDPSVMRSIDGIPGWTRSGPPERYNKEGLYGYIDGGAEIVLQYGFRELAVSTFKPAAAPAAPKEVVLEIYRMASGEAAFGLYSTKLEGEEEGWPGIGPDNWISPGQASLVKGEFLVSILAPECTDKEIGEFMAALEPKIPGSGTVRPEGMDGLPREGMIPSSWRFIKGPLAARNESPFLEGEFWGFGGTGEGDGATEAFSAKYGTRPAISKLIVIKLGTSAATRSLEDGVQAAFEEYLQGVKRAGTLVEGRNDAGRWFLYRRSGPWAALVLGEPDEAAARARLDATLALAGDSRGTAPDGKPKTFVVVTFDTEDYITPEAERIDDIPKWLAETMSEEGVTGTFFVIGEKARSLEKRGRRDVIAAMAKHDIGSHTNFGSIHPTVTEELEKAGWVEGCTMMRDQERAGLMELERIFGVPVRTLARHGGSYGPQLVAALGNLMKGYQGSPASLPGHDVVWFCNALNFSAQYAGFDDSYYRDDLFEPVFEKLKADLPGVIKTSQVLALFAGHPTKIRAEEFWDLNFYYGKNTRPEEWRVPRLRPRETMATAQKNFRRMMRWLKSRDDIEITTYRELMDVYSRQREWVSREELRDAASRALREKTLAPTDDLSPAEIFAGMAEAISGYRRDGRISWTIRFRQHLLGPIEMPPAAPGIGSVTLEEAFDLADLSLVGGLADRRWLPASLDVRGARIGTGSLFALFCAVYLDLYAGRTRPIYDVPSFEPYPRTNEAKIIAEVEGYKTWPVHKPDLDMSRIVEFTKLQLWTLKPARAAR